MKGPRALLVVLAVGVLAAAGVRAQVAARTFDQDPLGDAPSGFAFATARHEGPATWVVREDAGNRYLSHLANVAAFGGLSLAVLQSPHPPEMRASVRLKLPEGEQIGGLVWRYENAENFYLVALDLAVQEIALYRVVRGNRIKLEDEDDLELDPNAWHSLRVVQDDERIRVSLGGIGVMRARDRDFAAGATVWFDDLRVEDEEARRR